MKRPVKGLLICLAAILTSAVAHAYVPPTYYLAEKIAKHRSSLETAIVQVQIQRPALAEESAVASTPWQGNIFYNSARAAGTKDPQHWPLLSLLLDPEGRKVLASWRAFGLPANREEELVIHRSRQDSKANPESDPPFYRREDGLSLRRLGTRLAFQLADAGNTRKLLIEKESFDPLFLVGPCPDGTISALLEEGKGSCSLEFHYDSHSSMEIPSSVTLKAGEREVLTMKINRVIVNPSDKLIRDLVKPSQTANLEQNDDVAAAFYNHFLH